MKEINGTYLRDLSRNAQNNYSVFLINSATEYKKTVKLCGCIPQYVPGTPLRLFCEENPNEQYRDTYIVKDLEENSEFISSYEIREFLQSLSFPKKAIDYLCSTGGNIFTTLRKYDIGRLVGVDLNKSAVQAMAKVFLPIEQRKFRSFLLTMLDEKELPAYSVINNYIASNRNMAISSLIRHTYKVCVVDLSMGFKEAKKIATALGTDYKKNMVEGIVTRCLLEEEKNGSTCIPFDKALTQINVLSQQIEGSFPTEQEIKLAIMTSPYINCSDDYLSFNSTYDYEMAAASTVNTMRAKSMKLFQDEEIAASIVKIEKELGITYAPAQKRAFNLLRHTGVSILTGGPGTGKTTTVNGLIRAYRGKYPSGKIILCAPTGRAAQRMSETTGMEASTLHRLLSIGTTLVGQTTIDCDLLICDESSMLDSQMAAYLLSSVSPQTLVMLVGDVDQLPSVGCGDVFQDMILSKKLPVCKLETVFRQSGESKIVVNANRINNGEEMLEQDNTFKIFSCSSDQEILEKVRDIHMKHPNVQFLCPSHKGESGIKALNKMLQDIVNPRGNGPAPIRYGTTEFRQNDKIILVRNNYEKGYFNGDMGFIAEVTPNGFKIILDNAEKKVIDMNRAEIADVSLAYCISIHKSQGSEFPVCCVVLPTNPPGMLKRNLLYTGVTRAKSLCFIVEGKNAISKCVNTIDKGRRLTRLKKYIC